MKRARNPGRCAAALLAASLVLSAVAGTDEGRSDQDVAARILGAALVDGDAYRKLSWLCDRIGHRLSGSPALDRAVEWAVEEFRRDGLEQVWTEGVMVPRWVRGAERATIVAPREAEMAVLALGGSVGTTADGIEAEVVEVGNFEELAALGDRARGKIVLFNKPIEAGFGNENGYGSAVGMRVVGPSRAARLGAVATLIRSLGTADYRLPHTGSLRYEDGSPQIPAAAIAAEDAELIQRLLAAGEAVRVRLKLDCRTLPEVESANVLAEIRGREKPDEIVLIGAHLDSWDVGQGAHDDGAGVAVVLEAMRLLNKLELRPRRTVRAVLFTNEENGLRGGRDYATRHADELHVAAIESDAGGDAPRGFGVSAGEGGVELVRRLARPLRAIDADRVFDRGGGADITPLRRQGVPVMGLFQDTQRYFDYHHTAADTLDKVDPDALARNAAALTWMAWALAESPDVLPRLEPQED